MLVRAIWKTEYILTIVRVSKQAPIRPPADGTLVGVAHDLRKATVVSADMAIAPYPLKTEHDCL